MGPLAAASIPAHATAAGYVGLSKNSFEGRWPSPCEPPRHVAAFAACADSYWREAAGAPGDAGPEDNCVNHDALASLTLGRSHGAESSMAALDADSILCVASFLRLADVLNLCAASREW